MGKQRPWKKHAKIERVELNSGDVKFEAWLINPHDRNRGAHQETFESLDAAEAYLDAWWAKWWPAQTKSTRRA